MAGTIQGATIQLKITASSDTGGATTATRAEVQALASGIRADLGPVGTQLAVLSEREKQLARDFQLGRLEAGEYGAALRTLRADTLQLSNTVGIANRDLDAAAKIAASAQQTITGLSRAEIRAVDSAELMGSAAVAMSGALQGNISALAGLSTSLRRFFIGNPHVVAILGGITAIIVAWQALKGSTDDAADAQNRYMQDSRRLLESRLKANLAEQALLGPAPVSRTVIDRFGEERQESGGTDPHGDQRARLGLQQAQLNEALSALRLRDQLSPDRPGAHAGDIDKELQQKLQLTQQLREQMGALSHIQAEFNDSRGRGDREFNQMVAANTQAQFFDNLKLSIEATKASMQGLRGEVGLFGEYSKATAAEWGKLAGTIGATVQSGLLDAVSQSLQGNVKGLEGFGKIIANVIGGAVITMGEGAIGIGIGSEAIAKALKGVLFGGGVAAIVAGVALIALGSRIRGLAGGVGNQISTGFGGGGGGGGGGSLPSVAGSATAGTIELHIDGFDPYNPRHLDRIREAQKQLKGLRFEVAG